MVESKTECLPLDEKSWHYRLTKFVWGPKWDIHFDKWAHMDALIEHFRKEDQRIMNLRDNAGPEGITYTRVEPPTEADFTKEIHLSLCPYMRRVIASLIFLPIVCIGKLILKVPSPKISPFPSYSISWEKQNRIIEAVKYIMVPLIGVGIVWLAFNRLEFLLTMLLGVGIVMGIVGLVFGIAKLQEKTRPWRREHPIRKRPDVKEYKEPKLQGLRKTLYLISAFLRARHKKVCPCLERVK